MDKRDSENYQYEESMLNQIPSGLGYDKTIEAEIVAQDSEAESFKRTPLGPMMNKLKWVRLSFWGNESPEHLLVCHKGYEYSVVFVTNSNLMGNKKIIQSDKPAVIFYFNNISEKFWRRFGITLHIPFFNKRKVG